MLDTSLQKASAKNKGQLWESPTLNFKFHFKSNYTKRCFFNTKFNTIYLFIYLDVWLCLLEYFVGYGHSAPSR